MQDWYISIANLYCFVGCVGHETYARHIQATQLSNGRLVARVGRLDRSLGFALVPTQIATNLISDQQIGVLLAQG
jgi:hypothetical protein